MILNESNGVKLSTTLVYSFQYFLTFSSSSISFPKYLPEISTLSISYFSAHSNILTLIFSKDSISNSLCILFFSNFIFLLLDIYLQYLGFLLFLNYTIFKLSLKLYEIILVSFSPI